MLVPPKETPLQSMALGAAAGLVTLAFGSGAGIADAAFMFFALNPEVSIATTIVLAGLADQPSPTNLGALARVSNNNLKHISKHLEEFQALDPKATAADVVALGQRIASNSANFLRTTAGRREFQQTLTIGGKIVTIRVVLNPEGGLRSVHFRHTPG